MRPLFALVMVTLAVAGCAAQRAGAPTGWPVGREFWSTAVTENGHDHPLVAGTRISIQILDGRDGLQLAANGGCNTIDAYGQVKPDRVAVSHLAETAMGCLAPGAADQDAFISDFLSASPSWQLSGDTLVLTAGQRVMRLIDRHHVDPDRPLIGTRWTVSGAFDRDTAHSVATTSPAWITFGANGRLTGDTGCAAITASYTQQDQSLNVGPPQRVNRRCDASAQTVDADITRVLSGQVYVQIAYSTMRLTNVDGYGLDLAAS